MSSPELPPVLVTHPRNRLDTYFGSEAQAQMQHIARYLCPVANALGMREQATDPFAAVDMRGLVQTDLAQWLAGSDFVVCLAPADAGTENMMNAQAFAALRAGSFFINAAPDQMPTAVLARHPKVIASPHIGGLTPAAIEHQALETVRQTAENLQGGIPSGSVNADGATRMCRPVDRAVGC
jgi:D-3-phosphoglycerate dehydrogenase / 2-oxoglutarate reductase